MLKKHSQMFEALFAASDLLVVSVAWLASYWLRFYSGFFPVDKGIPPYSDYLRMLVFVWIIWATVFRRVGLYKPRRGTRRFSEVLLLLKANAISVVFLLAATYLFFEKTVEYSRLVFVVFWAGATVFTVLSRMVVREFLRALRRRGYNIRYVLVVGSGDLATRIARRINTHPEFGHELIGCLCSGSGTRPGWVNGRDRRGRYVATEGNVLAARLDEQATDIPIVGTYEDLPRFLAVGGIDQVIVALPLDDHDKLEDVILSIGDSMVDVKVVPDVHHFIQLGSEVEEFDGMPVVSLASTPLSGLSRVKKRALDFLLGNMLFVIFAPIMAVIAVVTKLTNRGPIFFAQERVGLDGKRFNIYKFRTMALDAEQNGARFAVPNDPRVTRFGKFLRATSLDELPQLLNVIMGHMSLVGPRPERPVFIDDFRKHVPRYMLRHKVQAGMTGWAQVNGWRGNTSIEKRIEHDLFYIENWSLGLDLKILGLTLFNGFKNRNAY